MSEPAILTARTVSAILDAVARATWDNAHSHAQCPPEAIPSEAALTLWVASGNCPEDSRREADLRLFQLVQSEYWVGWQTVYTVRPPDTALSPSLFAYFQRPEVPDETTVFQSEFPPPLASGQRTQHAGTLENISSVHAKWIATSTTDRPQHPIAPLVAAWQARPVEVAANLRPDRIIPAQLAMFESGPDDARGRLFRSPPRADNQLPLFEAGSHGAEYVTPSLPLALYELGVGREVTNCGSGAPLALRLFIEAILAVRLADRTVDRPVALSLPMRELLPRLYPGRKPKPNEWRPLIEGAAAALDSREARIDWGGDNLRRVVTMTGLPQSLDDTMRLIVDLPPGAVHGPQVSPQLHTYGPKHGRHYRALLNLAYWWHEPGRTSASITRSGIGSRPMLSW